LKVNEFVSEPAQLDVAFPRSIAGGRPNFLVEHYRMAKFEIELKLQHLGLRSRIIFSSQSYGAAFRQQGNHVIRKSFNCEDREHDSGL
jgi:hypothetical protein